MIIKEIWMRIRNLYNQGMKKTDIAKALGIDRKTVTKYLKSDVAPKYNRKEMPSKLDAYEDYIKNRLENYNLTSWKIYEEIKTMGYQGKYGIVNIYVRSIKKDLYNKAYIRFETMPGQQAQVDWGFLGYMYDKELKRTIKVNCFVMVLGYSRRKYIEFFEDQTSESFLRGHNNAFAHFCGYTADILYDNLKSVVIKRALFTKDSEFNKRFIDFAGYYGFNPILSRPYHPNTKGKVEVTVKYVKTNFYAGEEFYSLREMNDRAKLWLKKTDEVVHYTTKEKPIIRFQKENLISIENKKLYDLSTTYYRKVYKDCHFSFEGNFYSVPYQYANKEINIKIINKQLIIRYRDSIIAKHALMINKVSYYITKEEHITELREINNKKGWFPKKKPTNLKTHTEIQSLYDINIHDNVEKRNLEIYEEALAL